MWSVFLLLLRRDLYPDIRIKILERIDKRFDFIMSCESLRAIATAGVSSFGYSGTILIARRQTEKDMCRGFLQRSLVPLNARIAPAQVLRKYAHYLMEGEGLVLQDPELAKLLLEQAEIEEAALDLTLDLKNMSLTSQ